MVRSHITTGRLVASLLALGLLVPMAASATARSKRHHHRGGNGNGGAVVAPNLGQPVPSVVGTTTGTITFTPASVPEGDTTIATGTLAVSDAGQPVALEIETRTAVWDAVATSTVGADGSFSISWKATVVGIFTMRVVSGAVASATASVSSPEAPLTITSSVIATWYGPGLYGHHTACGETLTRHILGLASRSLPCGTPVTLFYNGESLTVPVIDRGPYANGATFDLTSATAQALGILETVNVGYTDELGKKIPPAFWYPSGSSGATGTTGVSPSAGASVPSGSSATAPAGSVGGGAVAP
jgi:rare lipoprotein A